MAGTVLFVDDEENILASIHRLMDEWLEERGCVMATATSVAQALALIEADPGRYPVVVSDLKMPRQTGTVLLTTVHERWPEIGTILMTGYAEMEEIRTAIKAGIVAFIQKPWDPDLLRAEVAKALELASLRRKNREYLDAMAGEVAWSRKIHQTILMGDRPLCRDSGIGVAHRSAQGLIEGGGDFFQVLWSDARSSAVCLGTLDVRGAQGTYFALLIREMLGRPATSRAQADAASPARILEALNGRMIGGKLALPGCFMSLTVCVTRPASDSLLIATAGGESFFLIRGGSVEEHHLPSPGLGYRDGMIYQDREFPFLPGDRLALASRTLVSEPARRARFQAALAQGPDIGADLDGAAARLLAGVLGTDALPVDATAILLERPAP